MAKHSHTNKLPRYAEGVTVDHMLGQIEEGELALADIPSPVLVDLVAVVKARLADDQTPRARHAWFACFVALRQLQTGDLESGTEWAAYLVDLPDDFDAAQAIAEANVREAGPRVFDRAFRRAKSG